MVKHWGEIRRGKHTDTKARACVYITKVKLCQLVSDNPNDA